MKIGFIFNQSALIGGGEISCIDLAASLRDYGVTPVALVPGSGEIEERLNRLSIPVTLTEFPRFTWLSLLRWPRYVRTLARTFSSLALDLVHVNGARSMLYAGPAARHAQIPCVWHNRVLHRDYLLDRIRGHYADAVIANSNAVADTLEKTGISRISTVYNGFAIEALKQQAPLDLHREFQVAPGIPIILAVGRLCAWKGFDDLLEACSMLNRNQVKHFCLILGKSVPEEKKYIASLLDRKEKLKLSNVHFAGWRNDAAAFMKGATLLAVPSHAEPFGRIVVEAWACGLPVIATDAAGPAEIIRHGENGILVPPKKPKELAIALAQLLDDPSKRAAIARAGMIRAGDFTLEQHRDAVLAIYRSVLARNHHGKGGAAP
jgi:glycosyltransferase involved in cell wall biosynthesis